MYKKLLSFLVLLLMVCSSAMAGAGTPHMWDFRHFTVSEISGLGWTWQWTDSQNDKHRRYYKNFGGEFGASGSRLEDLGFLGGFHVETTSKENQSWADDGFLRMDPNSSILVQANQGQIVTIFGRGNANNTLSLEVSGQDKTNPKFTIVIDHYNTFVKTFKVDWTGGVYINNNTDKTIIIEYISLDNKANYVVSGNSNDCLTFSGTGQLYPNTCDLGNYSVEIGNGTNGDMPKVNSDGFALVKDHFPGHAEQVLWGEVINGYNFPQAGSYYVIKPKTFGRLNVWVKGVNANSNANQPLYLVDINGTTLKTIPFGSYNNAANGDGINLGYLEGGKTYYLFADAYSVLYMKKMEFYAEDDPVYFEDYTNNNIGDWIWIAHSNQAQVKNDGDAHENYAKVSLTQDKQADRASYTEFEGIGSRTKYTIEFDAAIKEVGSDHTSTQIAIYNSDAVLNSSNQNSILTSNYIFSVTQTAVNSTTYKINNDANNTVTLNQEAWYHFRIEVDETNHTVKYAIKPESGGNQINGTINNVTGHAKGLHFNVSRWTSSSQDSKNNCGKFDNIKITSSQDDLGSLSIPKINVTHINSDGSRVVTITAGVSDVGNPNVRTYWWFEGEEWYDNNRNFTGSTHEITVLQDDGRKIYVRSVILDYATIESETAELQLTAGSWALTGGIKVVDMVMETSETDPYLLHQEYFTPVVRAYTDLSLLPENDRGNINVNVEVKNKEYGNNTQAPDWAPLSEFTTFSTGTDGNLKYVEFKIPISGQYRVVVSGTGYTTGTTEARDFYKGKYKVTYQTPNFAEWSNPVLNKPDANLYGDWNEWERVTAQVFPGWQDTHADVDYQWTNKGSTETTSTINYVNAGYSNNHASVIYNFRTVQRSAANPITLKTGWGLVKNLDEPWDYRCQLAHVGMGNEIPMYKYDTGKGGTHNYTTVYPDPYINSSNVPECDFHIPARAALVEYKVYTPVEPKVISTKGIATFSSYHAVYLISTETYLNNDEYVSMYRALGETPYGTDYYLYERWYGYQREGLVIASDEHFYNKDITESSVGHESDLDIWDGPKTIELRIIPDLGDDSQNEKKLWNTGSQNYIKSVLLDGDANTSYITINGSEDGTENSPANLILYPGTTRGVHCMNFYSLPSADTEARLYNHSAYLRMNSNFVDYIKYHRNDNNIKIHFLGNEDDEATVIDYVENDIISHNNDGAYYTISGQKVNRPTKGIYIHNGKKVFVK